jgi:hypothetical protein
MEETKKCPYCGGEILATAKKCKHCKKWLNTEQELSKSEQKVIVGGNMSENQEQDKRKEKRKKYKWFILVVVIILLAALAPFVYTAIDQAILDAKYDKAEKQFVKEAAVTINEENDFLKQAEGNILFMDTPVGGNLDDFLNYLKKRHSEIFSTSPTTSRDGDRMKASWVGSYHNIDDCIYSVVADNNNNVLYINIRIEDFDSNKQFLHTIISNQNESYGEPYTKRIEGYKESARWILPNGNIDWDIFYNTDKPNQLNIQIGGNEWKKQVQKIDPVEMWP